MRREIRILNDFIQSNMIDKTNDCAVIKGVYVGVPQGIFADKVPCIYLMPSQTNSLQGQYVGEDTHTDNVTIRVYVGGSRKSTSTVEDPTPATLELIDLTDTLIKYLRVDPTFRSRFVTSEISNINYKVDQTGDVNVFRYSEFTMSILSRQLWSFDGKTDDNEI